MAGERGLPSNTDAERLCLGSILLAGAELLDSVSLKVEDYSLESHRRVYARMLDLRERGVGIDRVTLAEELSRQGQLESVGGYSFLISLDEGMPEIPNLEDYVEIVREKSRLRQIIFTSQSAINQALLAESNAEDISATVTRSLGELGGDAKDEGQTPEEIVLGVGIEEFLDPTKRKPGLMTGFRKFDEMTNGLHGGELTVLGARPSAGKTAWALQASAHIARTEKRLVAFFSLEMGAPSLLTRLVCSESRVDNHKYRCGYLNYDERRRLQEGLARVCEMPLRIFDAPGIGMPEFTRKAKKLVKDGVALIVLDYLQLMDIGTTENRNVGIGKISRGLKTITLEYGIPILVLSQLSRPDKTARMLPPIVSDLRDSGEIEQNADNVVFVWREELVKPTREDIKGVAEIRIAKQRNGPIANCGMRWISHLMRFEEKADDTREMPFEESEPEPARESEF